MTRMLAGSKLVIASHNPGKVREIAELLEPLHVEVVSAAALGLAEPEETEPTFEGNALIKAQAAARGANLPALADDSGLCVDALGGEPGVYTADWAQSPNGRTYDMAMRRVEDRLQAVGANSPGLRKGSFNATLCLAHPDGRDDLYVGKVTGTMVWPYRGDAGFGFDPMFMPDGFDITFGEMPSSAKHSWAPGQVGLSHRARAFAKFVEGAIEQS